MEPWVKALDILIRRSGISKRQIDRDRIAGREQILRWSRGKRGPGVGTLHRLLEKLGLTWNDWAEALQEAEGKRGRATHLAERQRQYLIDITDDETVYVKVPLYEVRAAAGGGAVVESERVVDELAFKRQWVKTKLRANTAELGCMHITGDSMMPTLLNGDIVLFDGSKKDYRKDGVFVIKREGEEGLVAKRIRPKTGDVVELVSDNPQWRPAAEAVRVNAIEIIGRVLWVGGRVP